jgi:TonB family protein
MTMYFSSGHLSSGSFDERTAHTLRALPRPGNEAQSRAGALLVTILIHAAVIVAFIVGVQVAAPILAPPVLMLHIETPKKDKLDLATPPPALLRPTILTVPPPEVVIQTPEHVMTAAPPVSEAPSPVASAPSSQRGVAEGRDSYLGRLLAQLNRFKHYPAEARKAHIEGVVLLHFVMDGEGHVTKAEIQKSSGRPALDREALALMERAQPLPALPADFPTRTLDAVVPIEFALNS